MCAEYFTPICASGNVPTEDIVKYGSWSNSGGIRMIEESQCHEFMALCRLGRYLNVPSCKLSHALSLSLIL